MRSEHAEHLLKQAERAERLSHAISDQGTSKRLIEISQEFRDQAERIDREADKSAIKRI